MNDKNTALVDRKCRPCEGGVDPLTADQAKELMSALHPDWKLSESGDAISREFAFLTRQLDWAWRALR